MLIFTFELFNEISSPIYLPILQGVCKVEVYSGVDATFGIQLE
jgi:hypothetical protein